MGPVQIYNLPRGSGKTTKVIHALEEAILKEQPGQHQTYAVVPASAMCGHYPERLRNRVLVWPTNMGADAFFDRYAGIRIGRLIFDDSLVNRHPVQLAYMMYRLGERGILVESLYTDTYFYEELSEVPLNSKGKLIWDSDRIAKATGRIIRHD